MSTGAVFGSTLGRTVVTRDGTALYVEERGEPDAPVTMVFAHGWVLDRRTWGRQLADLPRAAGVPVRMLAYDHRGHGRSDRVAPGTATLAQLGDDLAEVLAALVPSGPVVLAGHSMGGMTIMALVERHPSLFAERVAGVAFVNTSCGGLSSTRALRVPAPVARVLRPVERRVSARLLAGGNHPPGRLVARAARPYLRWLLFGARVGPVGLALTAELVAAHWPATLTAFRDTLEQHDRFHALAACQGLPVSVLCGTLDRLCPPTHSYRIVEGTRAALFEYADAGHMLPLERPAEVTARLAALVRAACAAPGAAVAS